MLDISVKFPHKRAFVTGAGSGLGAAFCRLLAQDGWIVGMCDNREEALSEEAAAVDAAGGTSQPFVLDVTDKRAYQKTAKTFIHDIGGIDLLINNAGVAGGGLVEEFQPADWEWIMKINFLGVVHGCHYFAPQMKEQRHGHILNVASGAAIAPVPRMGAYCASKAAVKSLSEVLYNELHDYEVGVSVLMPEYFRTKIHERTRGQLQEQGKYLIENAPYSAEDVAAAGLRGAASDQLHILFPNKIVLWWWLSRLAPRKFADFVRKEAEKRLRLVNEQCGMTPQPEETR